MAKPTVFISHVHRDGPSADALEKVLRKAILGGVDVFNSSNRRSISAGDPWRERVIEMLRNSSCVLVLASPDSVATPWVNFESGGAWVSGTRVIPCCIKGMKPSSLPAPLSHLQALNLANPDDLRSLIGQIAEMASLDFPSDFDVRDATRTIVDSWETERSSGANEEFLAWIQKAVRRPRKYSGTSARGLFRVSQISATNPQQTGQFPKEDLAPGDTVVCHVEPEGAESGGLDYCFATAKVADSLEGSEPEDVLSGEVKCLGQIRVYEYGIPILDEERGVEYHVAWLIVSATKA